MGKQIVIIESGGQQDGGCCGCTSFSGCGCLTLLIIIVILILIL
jgi:hypothetical protein